MKVYVVNDLVVANMFVGMGFITTTRLHEADMIQFTGGADVSPNLYNEGRHHTTQTHPERDLKEIGIFLEALRRGIPMAGICRGGQFLNVMNGGRMYQNVTDHCRSHKIIDLETGRSINVTSTHHQMMIPGEQGNVLATASESEMKEKVDEDGYYTKIVGIEDNDTEVVFYPNTLSLCFQPHPEYMGYEEMTDYYFELLKTKLGVS